MEGVEPVAAEHPIVAFGGDAAGEVGVGGDDWLGTDAGELVCLLLGQRCAERCNPDVASLAGEGDGDGIHRAFHDHRDGPVRGLVVEGAEQLRSLVEQRGVAGVEVFRSGPVGIAEVGMSSTDESEDLAVMDDREDDPVAEPVDQPAGACHGGDTGDRHFFVGDPVPPQVINEVGPAGGCVTGLEPDVVGDVCAEPVGQIMLRPR